MQALVVQDPVGIGYEGVCTMVRHLQGKPVERRIGTRVALITKENMTVQETKDLLNPPLEKYLK